MSSHDVRNLRATGSRSAYAILPDLRANWAVSHVTCTLLVLLAV